jgi:hypothetical protein
MDTEKEDSQKELSTWMRAHVTWLKQQVNNLKDIKNRREKPSGIDREIFAAEMELTDYVKMLRKHGYKI